MLIAAAVAGGVAFAGWVVSVVQDTPDLSELRPKPQGAVSTVYAADGSRLGFIASDTLRRAIAGNRMPLVMKHATVAIEDRRFYSHSGVDYVGIVRAAVRNATSDDSSTQGGSTLTMQLVRNLYTPEDRFEKTLTRKVREAKLAEQLEDQHSKEWILVAYLNNVPFGTVGGQTAIGVQAAARIFFDKPAAELTLPEAALLAGLPQAPSQYNPFLNPDGAERRRAEVLDAMVSAGYVGEEEAAAAKEAPLGVHRSDYYAHRREQFFFDYVKKELVRRYGRRVVEQGGLKVYTTINLEFQELARQAIAEHTWASGPSAALATVDPANGHILAMASSATYGQTVFNYATQSHRQPGSTFKVIDLMAAVREGIDPDTTYYTSRHLTPGWLPEAPTWEVQTDSRSYAGSISLANALPASDNTVFAQLSADIGPDKIRQAAYDMGITSHLDAYYAESIGGLRYGVAPLEMANAFATVSNGGWRNRATALTKVVHPSGRVDLIRPRRSKEFTDGEAAEVLGPMKAVIDRGTAAGLGIGCPNGGKTGTTSNNTDVWFVGITPRLSTAVWVGYPDDTRTLGSSVFGATIPGPIWHEFMSAAKGDFCGDWPAPKEPFEGSPFFGTYATTGAPDDTGSDATTDETGTDDEGDGDDGRGPYATPPQPAPQTGTPPAGGQDGGGDGSPPVAPTEGGGAGAPAG
jgi:penicillin-binding protein 1A